GYDGTYRRPLLRAAPDVAKSNGCLCVCRNDVHLLSHTAEAPCIPDNHQSVPPGRSPSGVPKGLDRDCGICGGNPAGIRQCQTELGTSHHSASDVLPSNRSRGRQTPVMSAFHPLQTLAGWQRRPLSFCESAFKESCANVSAA